MSSSPSQPSALPSNVGTNVRSRNVLGGPLQLHSKTPPTGFHRTGFCDVPPADTSNHSIAATVTSAFLDFSAAHGNDLRDGDKWCLCAARWKEALDARDGDGDPKVPRVNLSATNEAALKVVEYKTLKRWAAESAVQHVKEAGHHSEKFVKESGQIGGAEPRA